VPVFWPGQSARSVLVQQSIRTAHARIAHARTWVENNRRQSQSATFLRVVVRLPASDVGGFVAGSARCDARPALRDRDGQHAEDCDEDREEKYGHRRREAVLDEDGAEHGTKQKARRDARSQRGRHSRLPILRSSLRVSSSIVAGTSICTTT